MEIKHIEYIRWVDSAGVRQGWAPASDVEHTEGSTIHSCGIILKECDNWIVLVPHYSPETSNTYETICGEMHIPKCSIVLREKVYHLQIDGSNEHDD